MKSCDTSSVFDVDIVPGYRRPMKHMPRAVLSSMNTWHKHDLQLALCTCLLVSDFVLICAIVPLRLFMSFLSVHTLTP